MLRALDAQLSSFDSLIPAEGPDAAVFLSLKDALECNQILKDRQRSRLDFGSSRPSSSSSDPSGRPSGGAFARQFADGVAAVQHILDDILSNANSVLEQEHCIKRALRAQSSLLVLCLSQGPSKFMAAGVPPLAKLHAIKHLVAKVVAIELLKETGLDSSNACVALAAALSPSILTGFLDGSRLTVANLLICYNAYIKVRAPGSRAYSLVEILTTLTRFRSFISITIKLLAALGLPAESLVTLVDLAMTI
jgi:hypothetical protein